MARSSGDNLFYYKSKAYLVVGLLANCLRHCTNFEPISVIESFVDENVLLLLKLIELFDNEFAEDWSW